MTGSRRCPATRGRRRSTRFSAPFLVAVALAVSAVACAGDDDGSSGTPSTTGRPGAETSDPSPTSESAVTSEPVTTPVESAPLTTPAAPTTTGVRPEGFETARVEIRRADGTLCELCTYLARTGEERQLGLMQVTDLGGLDGMIFEFDQPGILSFWMKNTVMPLSAAWFGPDGDFVGAFDMTPCPPEEQNCPTYGPTVEALHVLEVPEGDLVRLGIGPGARLESVGEPCQVATVSV